MNCFNKYPLFTRQLKPTGCLLVNVISQIDLVAVT